MYTLKVNFAGKGLQKTTKMLKCFKQANRREKMGKVNALAQDKLIAREERIDLHNRIFAEVEKHLSEADAFEVAKRLSEMTPAALADFFKAVEARDV